MPACEMIETMPQEFLPNNFTSDDRRALIELGVEMRVMKEDFEEMRKEIRAAASPSKHDFEKLEADVRNLQNFRWWFAGAAVVLGVLAHLFLHQAGL